MILIKLVDDSDALISLFICVMSFSSYEHFSLSLIKTSFNFAGSVFDIEVFGLAGFSKFFQNVYLCIAAFLMLFT